MADCLSFGKYKYPHPIEEVPHDYLEWVISDKCECTDEDKESAVEEMQRRKDHYEELSNQ